MNLGGTHIQSTAHIEGLARWAPVISARGAAEQSERARSPARSMSSRVPEAALLKIEQDFAEILK